jgi:hypothetical protein
MKRLLFLATFMMSLSTFAQYQWDYGLKVGGANYLGDIGGKELTRRDFVWDMHLKTTNLAVGAYGRYKFSKRLSVAGNLDYIVIKDRDELTTNPPRRARNMNFRNRLVEIGARAEVTIWYDNDVSGQGYYNPDFKMYLFGGLTGFYSNPQGQIFQNGELKYDGEWFDLRPWKTEGQEKEYSAFGLAIPAGVGLYFTFNKLWRVGWEFSWRTTFTDYLDDISTNYTFIDPSEGQRYEFVHQTYQGLIDKVNAENTDSEFYPISIQNFQYVDGFNTKRGDPTHNDSYLTTQFTVGKVIRGRSKFYKSKYSWLKNKSTVRRTRAKF